MDDVEERLLAQIRANPDDDGPRLVYADLLTEREEPRGEYVRLALADARDELSRDLRSRYLELTRLESRWAKELGCDGFHVYGFRRGFPRLIGASSDQAAQLARLLRRLPFRGLSLKHGGNVADIARMPELALLEELSVLGPLRGNQHGRDLQWREFPPDELAVLVGSPHWTSLRSLELEQGALTDAGARILRNVPWLAQLEELAAGKSSLSGDGLAALFARPLPRLRDLRLWELELRDAGARAIANAELPALESLNLYNAGVTPQGGRELLASRNLATVRVLQLARNDLGGALAALARSSHTTALTELLLDHTYLGSEDAIALATARGFPSLVRLDLQDNSLGDEGATALASSNAFPRLERLDLQRTDLTRDGVMPFTRTTLPALASLAVCQNPLPTGKLVSETYYDQGYEVGGGTHDTPYSREEVTAWFTEAGSKLRIS